MSIEFTCACGKTLRVHDEVAGKRVRCPACDMIVGVPDAVTLEVDDQARPRPRRDEDRRRRRRRVEWDDEWPRGRPKRSSSSTKTILTIVGCVLFFVVLGCAGLLLLGGRQIRHAALTMTHAHNLKQIAVGIQHYTDIYNHYPQQAIYSKRGKPLLSWRVAILPYIEEPLLYQEFHLNEPWDSPHNKSLLPRMPRFYATAGVDPHDGLTHCLAFVGRHTVFTNKPGKPVTLGAITDGTSNTLMIAHAAEAVPWTKPEDMAFEPGGPFPQLDDSLADGYLVVAADGSVAILQQEIPPRALEALITRDGGEIVTGAAWTKQRW